VLYAGPARNLQEEEQAIGLACKEFSNAQETIHDNQRKKFLLLNHPGFNRNSTIIVSLPGKGVVGAAFLIERVFHRETERIKGVFISSVCIEKSERGHGYSKALIHAAIDSGNRLGAAMAVVIARRKVDWFYTQFGFWGMSQYNTLRADIQPWSIEPEEEILLRPAAQDDLFDCSLIYKATYHDAFGSCVRDNNTWLYNLGKAKHLNVKFSVIDNKGSIKGYAFHDEDGNIFEIATMDHDTAHNALISLAKQSKGTTLVLHIPPNHPVVSALAGLDLTISSRECPYGGHMVRVIKPSIFLNLKSREESENARGKMKSKSSLINEDTQKFMDDSVKIKAFNEQSFNNYAYATQLLSVRRPTLFEDRNTLDQTFYFNIPLIDQI
jgi:predicted N-acetyltransferase YhbS